jgi:hypothetical protein
MPKVIQQDLRLPLAVEIASRGGSIGMHQLDYVVEALADLFRVPRDVRQKRLRSGSPQFRNDVEWAKKLLLENDQLAHIPRRKWYITPKGYRWIEHVLRSRLNRLEGEALASVTERNADLAQDFPALPDERLCALIRSHSAIKLLLQQPLQSS